MNIKRFACQPCENTAFERLILKWTSQTAKNKLENFGVGIKIVAAT
jgi:hypothetical protein